MTHLTEHLIAKASETAHVKITEEQRQKFLSHPGWVAARNDLMALINGAYDALIGGDQTAVIQARIQLDIASRLMSASFLSDYVDEKSDLEDMEKVIRLRDELSKKKESE